MYQKQYWPPSSGWAIKQCYYIITDTILYNKLSKISEHIMFQRHFENYVNARLTAHLLVDFHCIASRVLTLWLISRPEDGADPAPET
jgi:hypothetical protein